MEYRTEHDSMGEVRVESDKYWGAQTQRSFENFKIGSEKMPIELIYAITMIKKACALTNNKLNPAKMSKKKTDAIVLACDEILSGKLNMHFPLSVWQTGSGTQTNMNVNEVIANRGNELAGEKILHPNDDVNMSQSSNDVFPSAIHLSFLLGLENSLLPSLSRLSDTFLRLEKENEGILKIGRTHLMDATPVSFSQEISGWRAMFDNSYKMISSALEYLRPLALGGTATGTGVCSPVNFGENVCSVLSDIAKTRVCESDNKFHALTSKDAVAFVHGALNALAANLWKIANDVRLLAGGPRCGLGEITIPANEPGSSIMPGKVNPTQCEAVTMVALQVQADNYAVSIAASQGNFELNVFMPVIAYNCLRSVNLLSEVMDSFNVNCAAGIKANVSKMRENLENSLMLVTALSPEIGYENAAKVAKYAFDEGITLKTACLKLGFLSASRFEEIVRPEKMIRGY